MFANREEAIKLLEQPNKVRRIGRRNGLKNKKNNAAI